MASDVTPRVVVEAARPRAIAAVHAQLAPKRIPAMFGTYLDQVYAAARAGAVQVDGQNIFLYHCRADGEVDAEFGVGVAGPFAPTGAVRYVELPTGQVATATHVGDYSGLRATHDAILAWCRANGRRLTDHSWEIYGHFDPAVPPRTDIYYLLAEEQGDRGVLEV